jgi:hypothetical protein
MRIIKVYSLAYSITIALMASGCASMTDSGTPHIDPMSFDASKKFAVVSIASLRTIQGERGASQMFKSADAIPGANTQAIINQLNPKIIRALANSKHFTLLPENTVLASKAYKNLAEDEKIMKVLFAKEMINVANKYKYISDENKYARLAKKLDVDGVIGITMHFATAAGRGYVSAKESSQGKKSYSAMASISVIAYNKNGNVIWQDSALVKADPTDTNAIILDASGMTSADFEELYPSAIEIGGKAVDILLARFNDMIAGKEISRIQSIK